jgi:hypothetical protein
MISWQQLGHASVNKPFPPSCHLILCSPTNLLKMQYLLGQIIFCVRSNNIVLIMPDVLIN